jgi:hypothetical protein
VGAPLAAPAHSDKQHKTTTSRTEGSQQQTQGATNGLVINPKLKLSAQAAVTAMRGWSHAHLQDWSAVIDSCTCVQQTEASHLAILL